MTDGRRSHSRAARRWIAVIAFTTALFLVATGMLLLLGGRPQKPAATRVVVAHAADPSAVAALPDGAFRYTERRTGRIREVDRRGRLRAALVASVQVRSSPGQRGLLGLAVDRHDATFAAWTRRTDGRLVVGQVAPGATRLVWVGPPSAELANGGRLAFAPDGRLLLGVGDLQRPDRTSDPGAPNGKLLLLDSQREPTQTPRVLTSGWNNPFAFTYGPGNRLWVADNAPGQRPERITRGDRRAAPVATTGSFRPLAPAALVPLGRERLGLCGYVSRVMREVHIDGDRPERPGRVLVEKCAVAAAVLPDRRAVVTDDDTIRITTQPLH